MPLQKKSPIVDNKDEKAIVPDDDSNRESARPDYAEIIKERMMAWKKVDHYIDAALRSSRTNEVFIFCHREYVVVSYDPTAPGQGRVVRGPFLLCDGFPTLYETDLGYHGVNAAFGCHGVNEAYLFGGPSCVKIEYGPDIGMGNALWSPLNTGYVFSCLSRVNFANNIDAAFESSVVGEAYLFKGPKYALLNYARRTLIRTGLITDEFPCLSNTKFASSIRAAFASHLPNQAYLFKDDNSYVLIHYTPGKPNESYIVSGPEEMVPSNWPTLQGIVPFKKHMGLPEQPKLWTPQYRLVSRAWLADYSIFSLAADDHSDTGKRGIQQHEFGEEWLKPTYSLQLPPPWIRV